jgi:hypothetical protein
MLSEIEITKCSDIPKQLFSVLTMAILSLVIHSVGPSLEHTQSNPKNDYQVPIFQLSQPFRYLLFFFFAFCILLVKLLIVAC